MPTYAAGLMARLLFPALNKLEAENGRLRSRVVTLEAELQEKNAERIQFHQVPCLG